MKLGRVPAVIAALLISLVLAPVWGGEESAPPKEFDNGADVLGVFEELNGADGPKPPTKWRAGHAKAGKPPAGKVRKRPDGYSIQMAAQTAIPTPTIYEGKLYVGGGFNSRSFYCFDAVTGALVWAADLDDDGPSSAAVADGVCVLNTESCTVFALEAKTGKLLWAWWLGDPLTSTPAIADGRVFTSYPARGPTAKLRVGIGEKAETVAFRATHVLASFDLESGKVLWQRWLDADVMSAPVAAGGELLVTTFAGTVLRLEPATGKILSARRMQATSAPILWAGELRYTRRVDRDGEAWEAIVAQVPRSGAVNGQFHERKAAYLDRGVQVAGGYEGESGAMDAGNGFGGGAPAAANAGAAAGTIGQMRVSSIQAFQGSRILSVGGRHLSTMGDEILCVDAKTGKELWKRKVAGDLAKSGGFLATAPAGAGGRVVVATLSGTVVVIDPKDGSTTGTYQVGAPVRFQPAVVDGRIYVSTQQGGIVCIDTKDRTLTGWSTWGGDSAHTGVVK